MNAVVFHKPGVLSLDERDDPRPASGELVVRVESNTLCGTDQRIFEGSKTRGVDLPRVLGHEMAGRIHAVGQGVSNFDEGQRVAICPVVPCGRCAQCKRGAENACDNRSAFGYKFDGALADFVRIPAIAVESGNVFHVESDVPATVLSLTEPLSCCLNGSRRSAIGLGDRVLILGGGPIGLMHLQLALLSGAAEVIVSEPHSKRRELAESFGALAINPSLIDPSDWIRDHWDGSGADSVVVCVGIPTVAQTAFNSVRRSGTINFFAGFPPNTTADVDLNAIHYDEIVITGSTAMRRKDYADALRLIENERVDLLPLITHELPLTEVERGLNLLGSDEALKIAITP